MYVDDLFADSPSYGATYLYCSFPHTFVDVNRHELDLDPAILNGEWPVPLKPHLRTLKVSASSKQNRVMEKRCRSAS